MLRKLLFLAVIALSSPSYAVVIISDIDDTLKLTQGHNNGAPMSRIHNTFTASAFTGIPTLLRAAAANGAKIYYLSAVPAQIKILTTRFLRKNNLPEGEFIYRTSPREKTLGFKIKHALEIIEQNPNEEFVLLGDDSSLDGQVYKTVLESARSRIKGIFFHRLFQLPIPMEKSLYRNYVTTAELALGFLNLQLINEDVAEEVLDQVAVGLTSPNKRLQDETLPHFATLDCGQIKELTKTAGPFAKTIREKAEFIQKAELMRIPRCAN